MGRDNNGTPLEAQPSGSDDPPNLRETLWWILTATVLVAVSVAVLVLAVDYVLLVFLGVLFGIFLTKCSGLVGKLSPLSYGWNLAAVTTILLGIAIGGFALFGAKVENQLSTMSSNLDEAATKLDGYLDKNSMARNAFNRIPYAGELLDRAAPDKSTEEKDDPTDKSPDEVNGDAGSSENGGGDESNSDTENTSNDQAKQSSEDSSSSMPGNLGSIVGGAARVVNRIFSTALGVVANLGMIFFVGMFLAVDPTLYRDGFAKLFPQDRRDRVTEIMDDMSDKMFGWLNGRFIAMLITGAGTGISLMILGVPMAIAIGVLTGLLTFVPNIGGILALALAMLMAVPQGGTTVLWVLILYGVIQLIESNIITPLVQQNKTSIPPALLIVFQILMGALTGFLGILVATPMLAGLMVLVKEVWVSDYLGDEDV